MSAISARREWIIVCFISILSTMTVVARAEVPASVAVSPQSPDVDQIISQLEAKAQSAIGVWTTHSSREDISSEPWTTALLGSEQNGRHWYWKSLTTAPNSNAGLVVFDDSENVYVLPHGTDNRLGGERFQNTALGMWRSNDYLMSHYLLHMNLLPRQFLGALEPLSLIGSELLDGTRVLHLQASPQTDALNEKKPRGGRPDATPVIFDLYYDPNRRAIIQFSTTFTGIMRIELRVTSWNTFGTSLQWPATTEGRKLALPTSMPREIADIWHFLNTTDDPAALPANYPIDKPVLTTVDKFAVGHVELPVDISKTLDDAGVFFTPVDALQRASFYSQALSKHDNANDLAALMEAEFLAGQPDFGLASWKKLGAIVPLRAMTRFDQLIAPLAAECLRESSMEEHPPASVVSLLKQLTERVDDQHFDQIALNVTAAWKQLRLRAESSAGATSLSGELLPRLIGHQNVFVQAALIEAAQANGDNASLIDPHINMVLTKFVPASGLPDSPQDNILLGAVRII